MKGSPLLGQEERDLERVFHLNPAYVRKTTSPLETQQREVSMAEPKWRMKGKYIKNCNCAFGCPCDFNARPTRGHCEGMAAMQIETGHFGDVKLDGLCWAAVYHWPGALHEGNGSLQAIVDERADAKQREALLTIMSGKEQEEGTFFHILSLIVTTMYEPMFLPIDFAFDLDGRTAHVSVPGIFETASQPIRNPVTHQPHRIEVKIPEGFEYREAEIASAWIKGTGTIRFDLTDAHSSLALVDHTPAGPV